MIKRFSDGNMADVVRVGDIVRKQRGTWWDATKQVLNHLERAGYLWSPRVENEDTETVDLTYIPGKTVSDNVSEAGEELLREVGTRVHELHEALSGFRLDEGTPYVPWPGAPTETAIICHNDLSPWNTVVSDGKFQGFIDWDLVSYGTREWELAWVCWRWAPIYPFDSRTHFAVDQQIERCSILLKAYGLDALDLRSFVDLIDLRMECALEVVEQLGAQGVPGFDRLLATGMHMSGHDDRGWLAEHRDRFREGLESF